MHRAGIVRSVVFPPATVRRRSVAPNNGVARRSVDRPLVSAARITGAKRPPTGVRNRIHNAVSSRRTTTRRRGRREARLPGVDALVPSADP
ncbi:amidohydrolase 2 [Natronolimnohabitans innermongolicus JCM 12255]|uniref:Amidohydrolase 2 n=1 Tax=Natronolimnohabitans innermongolicus JCM 12255 TaxID=1227499 RepID=L9XD23_9EURY|nr:amidohydrolase 2 [Natronolimnohabitans innermongolicus JCM 12255]